MSLEQLPASPSAPRRSFLSPKFLFALTLALAACDKHETVESLPSPARAPTGAIVETLTDTTLATRHALARKVYEETLGTTGGDFYQRGFPHDPEHPTDWHIHQLDVGFGPQGGIHIVTVKQEGVKMHVKKIVDDNGDGLVDEFTLSTNWPIETNTEAIMVRSEVRSRVVGNRAYDDYASAMEEALRVLKEERKTRKGE